MKYDFSSRTDRLKMGSKKWFFMHETNPEVQEGVLPMTTADMEFQNAPEIKKALLDALEGDLILGYSLPTTSYFEAVKTWLADRHRLFIENDWIVRTPGVVAAINIAIKAFTNEGDGVLFFQPVYGPFYLSVDAHKRQGVNIPMLEEDGVYRIDFEAFEQAARQPENKLLLFCSPQNPTGRVWTREELERLAEICLAHDVIVLSDEIWSDFDYSPHGFLSLANINEDIAQQTLICTSASKSFNLATLELSNIIIPNEKLRQSFSDQADKEHYGGANILSFIATEAAYREAGDWFDEVSAVIRHNQELTVEFVERELPQVKTHLPEATYLMWLDLRAMNMRQTDLMDLLHRHDFYPNSGTFFGPEGEGFIRLNVALPTDALLENLERLKTALSEK